MMGESWHDAPSNTKGSGTMSRSVCRSVLTLVTFALALGAQALSQSPGFPSPKNGDWPHYTGDIRGSKYSPLDQINASNFKNLEVAWRFKTDNFGTFPEYKLEGTPLAIRGVLYTTAGTRRDDLGPQHARRETRRCLAAPVVGTRRVLLDRRQRRRARRLRDDRLSARR